MNIKIVWVGIFFVFISVIFLSSLKISHINGFKKEYKESVGNVIIKVSSYNLSYYNNKKMEEEVKSDKLYALINALSYNGNGCFKTKDRCE